MLQLLHERDDDSVEFTYVKRIPSLLAESINLVEHQHTRFHFGMTEKLPKVKSGLPKESTDNGIESDDVCRNAKLRSQSRCCQALPAAGRTVKEQVSPVPKTGLLQAIPSTPLQDDLVKGFPGSAAEHDISERKGRAHWLQRCS